MHWVPHNCIHPSDTVSSISYGPNGTLSCTTWNGKLLISRPSPSHEGNMQGVVAEVGPSLLSATFSRPLFAQVWHSSKLWFGGGENRISSAEITSGTTADECAMPSPVLSLAASTTKSAIVAATSNSLHSIDPRAPKNLTSFGYGAVCIDVHENNVCSVNDISSTVYDLRNLGSPLHEHQLSTGILHPLQAKWLDATTYAISDTESHVSVKCLYSSQKSFVFQSNALGGGDDSLVASEKASSSHAQKRPIYALSRGPDSTHTLVTGGGDGYVYFWDYVNRRLRAKVGFPLACTALAYSAESGELAVGLSSDEWSTTPAKFTTPSKARVMISSI